MFLVSFAGTYNELDAAAHAVLELSQGRQPAQTDTAPARRERREESQARSGRGASSARGLGRGRYDGGFATTRGHGSDRERGGPGLVAGSAVPSGQLVARAGFATSRSAPARTTHVRHRRGHARGPVLVLPSI